MTRHRTVAIRAFLVAVDVAVLFASALVTALRTFQSSPPSMVVALCLNMS